MYRVLLAKRALKDLEKFDEETKKYVLSKLKEYQSNPFNYAKKLTDRRIGEYRFRIGDYRVIFDLVKDDIVVLRIGHRKDIYK